MSPRRYITLLAMGMVLALQAPAQEAAAPDTVEIRDFNGQTRQHRLQASMWDKQRIGEWDDMAGNRLSIRRVPPAAMEELRSMKALQYEAKPGKPPTFMLQLVRWVTANIRTIRNIFYILLGSLLILTVILFIRKTDLLRFSRRSRSAEEEMMMAEEAGPLNFDALAQAAIAAEDYRSAVRMRYLQALHILQLKELIVPGKDKTNMDFLRELSSTELHRPFAVLTRQYEYIWYGKVPLNNGQFMQLDEQFAAFKKSLRH